MYSNVRNHPRKITAMFCATLKKKKDMIYEYMLAWGCSGFFCQYFSDQHSTLFIFLFYIHEQHMFLHVYFMIYLFQLIFYVSKQMEFPTKANKWNYLKFFPVNHSSIVISFQHYPQFSLWKLFPSMSFDDKESHRNCNIGNHVLNIW